MGYFITSNSAVPHWLQQWKNYWNRSIFAKIIHQCITAYFFWPTLYVWTRHWTRHCRPASRGCYFCSQSLLVNQNRQCSCCSAVILISRNDMPLVIGSFKTRKPCYRKDDRAMRPIAYMGALKIFGTPCVATPTANFPDILMDFCSDRSRNCAYKIWSSYLYPLLR